MDKQIFLDQLQCLVEDEPNVIANLSNISAYLNEYFDDINWIGFYLYDDHELVLGPFQGKVACLRIPIGKGVCGCAVKQKEVLRIDDVHQFPGHIACDSQSCSEIVLPIYDEKKIYGVLDIDSPHYHRFIQDDQELLEQVSKIILKYVFQK